MPWCHSLLGWICFSSKTESCPETESVFSALEIAFGKYDRNSHQPEWLLDQWELRLPISIFVIASELMLMISNIRIRNSDMSPNSVAHFLLNSFQKLLLGRSQYGRRSLWCSRHSWHLPWCSHFLGQGQSSVCIIDSFVSGSISKTYTASILPFAINCKRTED